MRLFRRRNEDANEPAEGSALSASGGTDDGGDVARPERTPTGDWMTLPPVATVSKPMPTTFRVQTLPEILTSHQDSRLSGELGHAVSADAPSGAIHGLTSSIGGSPTTGHGDLPLREPHHAHAPEPAPAPLTVRRLADTSAAPITATAPPAPSLPEPAVSRRAADPLPLASTPPVDRPLPVARAIDAPAAAAAPAPLAVSSGPSDTAPISRDEPSAAPLVGDDRVGGFEPDVDELLSPAAPRDHLASSPPPELAPPIQPRRVQRRAEPGAPSAPAIRPAAAESAPAAPLLGDATPATAADADPLPIAGPASSSPSPSSPASPSSPGSLPSTASTSTDLPLVSRSSPAGAASAEPSADIADIADTSDAPTVSRLAESSATPSAPSSTSSTSPSAPTAPLLGAPAASAADEPITTTGAASEPSHAVDTPAPGPALTLRAPAPSAAPSAPVGDLAPPIQRIADTAPAATVSSGGGEDTTAAPTSAVADAPAAADVDPGEHHAGDGHDHGPMPEAPATTAPSETTPTLGAAGPLLDVQTLADSGLGTAHPAPPSGAAARPLVQTEPAGTLQPPAVRPTGDAPEASADAPVQRTLGASPSSSVSPATSPLAPTSAPAATSAPAPLQRTLAASPSTASSTRPSPVAPAALASSAGSASAPATPGGTTAPSLPLVRPLAGGSMPTGVGLQRMADGGGTTAPASIATLSAPGPASPSAASSTAGAASTSSGPSDVTPILRRLPSPVDHLGGVVTAESLGVQRLADGPSAASSGTSPSTATTVSDTMTSGTSGGSMPLHSPALAVPTAADVAVKAGLAERGPNGTLLYTSAPGGGTALQRSVDGAANVDADVDVQRAVQVEELSISPTSSRSGGGTGDGDAPMDPAQQANAIYPFIRSALERDLRRQLEAKNRSTRFRP